jgi:hypothetical protein
LAVCLIGLLLAAGLVLAGCPSHCGCYNETAGDAAIKKCTEDGGCGRAKGTSTGCNCY